MFFLFSCNTRSQVKCYLSRLNNAYACQSINLDVWNKLKCRLLSLHQCFVSCMLEFGRVLQVHFQSSIGNSFRIEGSLVAYHTPKIQIYYLALYCCTSISFSASISWFRQVNNNLESIFCLVESSCPNRARVSLTFACCVQPSQQEDLAVLTGTSDLIGGSWLSQKDTYNTQQPLGGTWQLFLTPQSFSSLSSSSFLLVHLLG